MSDRHNLNRLNFFKATDAGNSYLTDGVPQGRLNELYQEAWSKGVKDGPVQLSNGQSWYINQTTGKFHPMEGPGILKLDRSEVKVMRELTKQAKSVGGDKAMNNINRFMDGANIKMTDNLRQAMESAAPKLEIDPSKIRPVHNASTQTLNGLDETMAFSDDLFRTGRPVNVHRTSGAIDANWEIQSIEPNGNVMVRQPSTGFRKSVPPEQLIDGNPNLLASQPNIKVRRSSGAIDEGWRFKEARGDGVVRITKDGMMKDVPIRDILALNQPAASASALAKPRPVQVSATDRAVSEVYQQNHRVDGRVPDGFVDGGRGMQFDPDGRVSSGREILRVDRAADAQLQNHLEFARSVKDLPETQRAQALAQYIDDMMTPQTGRENLMDAYHHMVNKHKNAELLIGDVNGSGVCRHRSLMFQVLGDEAGLQTSLVRGNAGHPGGSMGGHAWNEVKLPNGESVLVDVMNPQPGYHLPSLDTAGDWYRRMDGTPYYGN